MFSSLRARERASSVVDLDEFGSQHARLFEVSGRRAAARGGIQEAHVDVAAQQTLFVSTILTYKLAPIKYLTD